MDNDRHDKELATFLIPRKIRSINDLELLYEDTISSEEKKRKETEVVGGGKSK